jgi:hypothetical protein
VLRRQGHAPSDAAAAAADDDNNNMLALVYLMAIL